MVVTTWVGGSGGASDTQQGEARDAPGHRMIQPRWIKGARAEKTCSRNQEKDTFEGKVLGHGRARGIPWLRAGPQSSPPGKAQCLHTADTQRHEGTKVRCCFERFVISLFPLHEMKSTLEHPAPPAPTPASFVILTPWDTGREGSQIFHQQPLSFFPLFPSPSVNTRRLDWF